MCQIQAQLLVTGADLGYIAALIGGRGFALFQIAPHFGLMASIASKADAFIASLDSDTPPEQPPTLDTLKRIRRVPSKVAPRSDAITELYERLEAAKAAHRSSEKEKDQLQAKLLALLGDAEAAEVPGGLLTYYEQTRKESYVSASTFRVLRFQKGA